MRVGEPGGGGGGGGGDLLFFHLLYSYLGCLSLHYFYTLKSG